MNKTYFLYKRDDKGRPRCTVCLIWDEENQVYHRGVAICAPIDYGKLSKKAGRGHAMARAEVARFLWTRKQPCQGAMLAFRIREDLTSEFGYAHHSYGGLSPMFLLPGERDEISRWAKKRLRKEALKHKKFSTELFRATITRPLVKESVKEADKSCTTCKFSYMNDPLVRSCIDHIEVRDCVNLSRWQPVERKEDTQRKAETFSLCCNGPVHVDGDEREGTFYYMCDVCNRPTDVRYV